MDKRNIYHHFILDGNYCPAPFGSADHSAISPLVNHSIFKLAPFDATIMP